MTMPNETLSLADYFPAATYEDWKQAALTTLKGKGLDSVAPPVAGSLAREVLYTAAHPQAPRPLRPIDTEAHAKRRDEGWDIRAQLVAESTASLQESLTIAQGQESNSLWLPRTTTPEKAKENMASVVAHIGNKPTPFYWDIGENVEDHRSDFTRSKDAHASGPSEWRGGIFYDPIATLARKGRLTNPISASWEQLAKLTSWGVELGLQLKTTLIDGLPFQEAGAEPAFELACILGSLTTTLRAHEAQGLPLSHFGGACEVRVGIGGNMFVEVAKLRALRTCVRKIMQGCQIKNSPTIHAINSTSTMAARDHWVNLLRGATACFAAAIGGADAITLHPFDATLGTPSNLGQRQAINTQHVLAKEAHLHRVIDPAGGAWYLEHMSDQIARSAWRHFQEIEANGGILTALERGTIHSTIRATVSAKAASIANRKQPILGVSEHPNLAEETPQMNHSSVEEQAQDTAPLSAALHCAPLTPHRWSAEWEALRDTSDAYRDANGARPKVYLIKLGAIPAHKARASFATRFLAAGGFATVDEAPVTDATQAASAFAASGAIGAVFCGRDDDYLTHIPALADAFEGAHFVVVAGRMGDHEAPWREAGITHAIHLGCDALGLLQEFQAAAGVKS